VKFERLEGQAGETADEVVFLVGRKDRGVVLKP
jgi:hypothetical protein